MFDLLTLYNPDLELLQPLTVLSPDIKGNNYNINKIKKIQYVVPWKLCLPNTAEFIIKLHWKSQSENIPHCIDKTIHKELISCYWSPLAANFLLADAHGEVFIK